MNVFEEKMRQMLEEGRLSPEQYRELYAVLSPERPVPPPAPVPPALLAEPSLGLPGSVLACAIFLFIAAASQFQAMSIHGGWSGGPYHLSMIVIAEVGLGIGLLKMQRWAYLIQFPFALLSPLVNLFQANAAGFIFNAVYLVMMLYAWPAFYPGRSVAEVWRAIQEKYRQAQPNDSSPLPVPVRALAILLMVMAFLNVTGPFMAMYMRDFFTQYAGLNQLTSLHANILSFIYHSHFNLTPLHGLMAAATSSAFAYGIFRRNRITFILLTGVTFVGFFVKTAQGGVMYALLYFIRVILIVKSWRIFFPKAEDRTPESAPDDQRS